MTTVQGFYRALEVGDGDEAAKFEIPPEKNGWSAFRRRY
jgi:hypothetical protein